MWQPCCLRVCACPGVTLTVGAVADITGSYRLGPQAGRVLLKTGRVGLAAMAGHDLTIEVTRWSALIAVPADLAAATVTAELDLTSLAVRDGRGGAKPLTDGDRRTIEGNIAKILTGKAASAAFSSSKATPSGDGGGAIEGTLNLNGKTQPTRLLVTTLSPGKYRGTTSVVQTAFGIKPYTGFFGALKLRDEIIVEIEVDLNGITPD